MGCTISFTLPFAIGVVEPRQQKDLLFGMLCGVATIPIGCLVGGLFTGISLGALLFNLLPLLLLAGVTVLGLVFLPDLCVKIFRGLAWVMSAMITVGLVLGSINYLAGREVIPSLAPIEEAGIICLNASISLSGAFPLMFVVAKILKKPLSLLEKRFDINDAAAAGFISTLVSNAPTFGNMCFMDRRGVVLNAAFAVSAAFVFGGHLAFTLAYSEGCPFEALAPMIVGKLLAGVAAVVLALLLLKRKNLTNKEEAPDERTDP
jgi:ethanolamine transporter